MKKFGILALSIMTFVLGGCGGNSPTTYGTNATDVFVVDNQDTYTTSSKILQADYMFVVDVSASMGFNSGDLSNPMASKRAEFMGGLTTFANTLQSQSIDYRIGFINGNVNAGRLSELTGRGFYKNILINSIMPAPQQSSLIGQLQDIGQTLNQNTNLLLESADQVMGSVQSTFVREGSQLIYLFVSDSDDESQNYFFDRQTSAQDYADRLIAHKGTATYSPGFVNARAIVAGTIPGCDPSTDFGESAGRRLASTAALIENANMVAAGFAPTATSASVSHCILRASSDFPSLLYTLAHDVSKPTTLFKLQVKNVDPLSIQVFVGDFNNPISNGAWEYASITNAVVFKSPPPANTPIKITYNQFYVLSNTPADVSSINVKVNGSDIQLSSNNGWSYDPTTNRITFNGVTIHNGTRIEVSYK